MSKFLAAACEAASHAHPSQTATAAYFVERLTLLVQQPPLRTSTAGLPILPLDISLMKDTPCTVKTKAFDLIRIAEVLHRVQGDDAARPVMLDAFACLRGASAPIL